MLVIEIIRAEDGDILGFRAKGHAGFAERGKDIVCAGASAILHAAALGVARHLGLPARVQADEGYLELRLERPEGPKRQEGAWQQAQAVLEAAVLGIREIEKQYGEHVRLRIRRGGESRDADG